MARSARAKGLVMPTRDQPGWPFMGFAALSLVRGTMRSQSTERRAAPWWANL